MLSEFVMRVRRFVQKLKLKVSRLRAQLGAAALCHLSSCPAVFGLELGEFFLNCDTCQLHSVARSVSLCDVAQRVTAALCRFVVAPHCVWWWGAHCGT